MPRVNLARQKTKYDKLQALIYGQMGLLKIGYAELGAKMGICDKTMRTRIKNPEKLTLLDLSHLAVVLSIPADEMRAVIPFR